MFNTEYLYLRPLELGLLYGAFLMIPLIILIVLTAMGKVRGKPLRIIVVAFLSAVASISAMVNWRLGFSNPFDDMACGWLAYAASFSCIFSSS